MRRTLHILAPGLAPGLAGLLLIAVLAGYAGRWSPAFEIASAFRLHLALLAGATGLALGLVKLRRSAGLAILAALIAAAGLGPVFAPAQRPGTVAADSAHPLTLLYVNLWDRNPQPQALATALRAIDADILITSETTRAATDGEGGLRSHYPFQRISPTDKAHLRTAIWSKYPLQGGHLYLNNTVAPTAATAVADLGGGLRLGLIGAHFSRPHEGLRQAQADALGPMTAELRQTQLARPLIIAGDFNAPPWSWVVTRAANVTDTRIIGGHRITWKGAYPTPFGPLPAPWGQQIDHILLSGAIFVDRIETPILPGTDHRGLFVHLRIAKP
jgi:endonuclease/exonuclease/phosphatase (EEP) superfamily protein YafD